jgi:hypothetical protein
MSVSTIIDVREQSLIHKLKYIYIYIYIYIVLVKEVFEQNRCLIPEDGNILAKIKSMFCHCTGFFVI